MGHRQRFAESRLREPHSPGRGRPEPLPADQHDPPHRPAGDALDAGEQLHPPCPSTAAVVPQLGEEIANRQVAPARGGVGANTLPKPTAANLRRVAETPAARRAINCIKDKIACMEWRLEAKPDAGDEKSSPASARG